MEKQEKIFLTAKDVCSLLGVKRSQAYAIIKKLNEELKQANKLTISGKINRKYLFQKLNVDDL